MDRPLESTGGDVAAAIRSAIAAQVPEADVEVQAHGGGHFSVQVSAPIFRGRTMLENHRLVYSAIAPLLSGPSAPVHAIDSLRCLGK